jgi:hypothetical protein
LTNLYLGTFWLVEAVGFLAVAILTFRVRAKMQSVGSMDEFGHFVNVEQIKAVVSGMLLVEIVVFMLSCVAAIVELGGAL